MECTFVGNIAKDAELRWICEGDAKYAVTNIWVGENLGRSNVPEDEPKTAWRKVTLWRKYAEKMAQYLTKGRRIEIRNGWAGEAEFYVRKNKDGSQTVVPYLPITIGREGKIYFMDSKQEDNLPPEAVLNEQPVEGAVVITDADVPF